MTDYELTTLLESVDCDKQHKHDIMRILTDAQTVKFGKVEALKSTVLNDMSTVISFIEITAKSK